MLLTFEIRKAIAAVAFLLEKQGGQLDMFLSLKMLYLADKKSLIEWGKTITGDKFVSMPKGPVACPEWEDPKGSSIPINPRVILRNAGRTDEDIKTIEESNRAFVHTQELLGIR